MYVLPEWLSGKKSTVNAGFVGSILGQEDSLEKKMAIHSNTLAWEIPWREDLVGYSPWDCKELDTAEWLNNNIYIYNWITFLYTWN